MGDNAEEIQQQKAEFVSRAGPWTAECIHLGHGIYTFDEPVYDSRLRRCLQIAADVTGKPLDTLRVLDLACLEGHYGIEFALHGSKVVAIEGRDANLAKARFVKDVLSIENIGLYLDDVRNLSEETYGRFDVVLCLGLLYHLDAPDVMEFAERMFNVCDRVLILDTHFSFTAESEVSWKGNTYSGRVVVEHEDNATEADMENALWYSIDNRRAFYFTRPSLFNLLKRVGFTSIYECLNPYEYHEPEWPKPSDGSRHVVWDDRATFVAIKGQRQTVLSSPVSEASVEVDRPEKAEHIGSAGPTPSETTRNLKSRLAALRRRLQR